MIAWWIFPTLLTVLSILCLVWMLTARDLYIAALASIVWLACGGMAAFAWVICLLLKVFS